MDSVPDKGPEFNRVVAPFIGLSTAAIALRLWSRLLGTKEHKLWWDDWVAIFSWVIGVSLGAVGFAWTNYGLGTPQEDIPIEENLVGLKLIGAAYYLFIFGVSSIKLSVILFYQRVLATTATFKKVLICTQIIVWIWLLSFFITNTFHCIPVQKAFDPRIEGSCVNMYAWYMANGLFDALLDIAILILPMPILWRLHIGKTRKIAISVAFLCGYLSVVPSIGRFASTAEKGRNFYDDITYSGLIDMEWSFIEIPIGVIGICIPNWFYLFKRWSSHGFLSLFRSKVATTKSSILETRQSINPDAFAKKPKATISIDSEEVKMGVHVSISTDSV